jgi:hypothetical protein
MVYLRTYKPRREHIQFQNGRKKQGNGELHLLFKLAKKEIMARCACILGSELLVLAPTLMKGLEGYYRIGCVRTNQGVSCA